MRQERDAPRGAGVDLALEERGDVAVRRADLVARERLLPDVEELAEGVDARGRRLDVDDPVARVRVEPCEAGAADDEASDRRRLHLARRPDADPLGDLALLAVDEERQVDGDVVEHLLVALAADPVHRLAEGGRSGRREGRRLRDRHLLGAERAGRAGCAQMAEVRDRRKGQSAGAGGALRAGGEAGGDPETGDGGRGDRASSRSALDRHSGNLHGCGDVDADSERRQDVGDRASGRNHLAILAEDRERAVAQVGLA